SRRCCRRESLPVRRKPDIVNVSLSVLTYLYKFFAALRVPNSSRSITTGGGNALAVAAKLHFGHLGAGIYLKDLPFFFPIPGCDGVIPTARREISAVGAERHRI